MSYLFYQNPKIETNYSTHYLYALFGINHAAFLGNDHILYVPEEDKESIQASLSFYYDFVLGDSAFPVFDGKTFSYVPTEDKKVLEQIRGLPDALFSSLDLSKDILSQIHFAADLTALKKSSYQEVCRPYKKKYFSDDFRMYCLKQGFFFPYEETKPFIEEDHALFPVYYIGKKLSPFFKDRVNKATSERFAIDYLSFRYEEGFVGKRKAFDSFSLRRRISYFINGKFDSELADLNSDPVFRKRYAALLRRYVASLINSLYDHYCFDVLNKVTTKVSYLTPCLVHGRKKNLYAISSFNGERYTENQKDFYFDRNDYSLVKSLIEKEYYIGEDRLCLYAKLGLPFEGYLFLKDKKASSIDQVLSYLPFKERKDRESPYLSVKRFDLSYSYLPEEKEHRYVFAYRRLVKNGITFYASSPLLDAGWDNRITIVIGDKAQRKNTPLSFRDEENGRLSSWPLSYYLLKNHRSHDTSLFEKLSLIDQKSHNRALHDFFRLFSQTTRIEAISILMASYSLSIAIDDTLKDFFFSLLCYPFYAAEALFRFEARKNKDTFSLRQLDGEKDIHDTYEPNLPYPYVSYGELCYSFRKTRLDKAYVCSCQRKAIENKIDFLRDAYKKGERDEGTCIKDVLSRIGLPENILSRLNPYLGDIKSQIPYKDGICHLCNHSIPSYHEAIDENRDAVYNVYSTYVRAKASENGAYFLPSYGERAFSKRKDSLYPKQRDLSLKLIDPILKPYISFDPRTFIAYFASFFGNELYFSSNFEDFQNFIQYRINDENKDSGTLPENLFDSDSGRIFIFHLIRTYQDRRKAYGIRKSSSFLVPDETPFSLNRDYNPKLPHPYVFLGRHYNAYADDPYGKNLSFCLCDKETMKKERQSYQEIFDFSGIPSSLHTALLLGLVGLPYLAVLKYRNIDLSLTSLDDLRNRLPFKESICRRCLNIPHCAYLDCFKKARPLKENAFAEYSFAVNGRLHDEFLFVTDRFLSELSYHQGRTFDLDSDYDPYLPCLTRLCKDGTPEAIFSFFVRGEERLKDYLFEYSRRADKNAEINAYANGILEDAYRKDPKCLLKFITSISTKSYRALLTASFPDVLNIRKEIVPSVRQNRLGFFSYLYEKLIDRYVSKEKRIGE